MDNLVAEQLLDWVRNHYFGKYRGTITDNNDSTNRGRVKVSVPAVLGTLEVWAMPCFPYQGDGVGIYMIPEAGAGVWVEFEAGNPSYPIWSGGFWADNELPNDQTGSQVTPSLRMMRSEQGLIISMDDNAQVITLSDSNGNNILTIDSVQSEIKLHGSMKVVIDGPQIELVENSTHPLVYGDSLLSYLNQLVTMFNTHQHVGEMALGVFPVTPMIPVVQFPPATPDLLSVTVTTG
jgi:uncharacterized protein involved in type VI secretion and phage assembly